MCWTLSAEDAADALAEFAASADAGVAAAGRQRWDTLDGRAADTATAWSHPDSEKTKGGVETAYYSVAGSDTCAA